MITVEVKNLDCISREEKKAILSNTIIDCMKSNSMTLENLDESCEIVKEVYRKNAMIKG